MIQRAHKLPEFRGQRQEQTEWCWAAACASISDYYCRRNGTKAPPLRQCQIVRAVAFPHLNCCQDPGRCNVEGAMNAGMKFIKHYRKLTNGVISMATVQAEIDAGCPIGVRVLLATGQEHIVVIYGYAENSVLYAFNPARGYVRTDMNNWVVHLGWWQNTCFTQ